MPVGGRVAGKGGGYGSSHSDRSNAVINENIIWTTIGLVITLTILITIALCYLAHEKYKKRKQPHR